MMSVKGLQEKRNALTTKMRGLITDAGDDGFTPEVEAEFTRMNSDQESLKRQIDAAIQAEKLDAEMASLEERAERVESAAVRVGAEVITRNDQNDAVRGWLLGGQYSQLRTDRQIAAMQKCGMDDRAQVFTLSLARVAPRTDAEARALAESRATSDPMSTTAGAGGNMISQMAVMALERRLVAFGGMRQGSEVLRTATGGTLPIPTNTESVSGAILAENTATTTHTPTFGVINLGSYLFTSHLIPVSLQLAQDSAIDLPMLLGDMAGTRIGRIQNNVFTLGESSDSKPQGLVDSSSNSAVAGKTSSTQNQVIYSELVDLYHSVDPAYRASPTAAWMFNDNTLSKVRALVDSNGQPLWQPSLTAGAPDRLFGAPIIVNQDMVSFSTTGAAKTMAYGDIGRYIIRDVLDVTFRRLDERYAEQFQIGFLAGARADGALRDRTAVKHLVTAST